MEIPDYLKKEMTAYEAFIRRAVEVDLPFMLKGSYITRQYFPADVTRFPADLDWVYLDYAEDEDAARQRFDEWAILVTELDLSDGVTFRSFKEDRFWRMIDYAMADDFPTVNTDLVCWVDGEEMQIRLDISFNLDIEQPPVALPYHPLQGSPFIVPNSVPLSLQISWKIHQTLVRPRFKDLFDLTYLLLHSSFTDETLNAALLALINECNADKVDLSRLRHFLSYEFGELFPGNSINDDWNAWRHKIRPSKFIISPSWGEAAERLTDATALPDELIHFLRKLEHSLKAVGFNAGLMNKLPKPTMKKRKTYQDISNSFLSTDADDNTKSGLPMPPNEQRKSLTQPENDNLIPAEQKPKSIFNFIRKLFKYNAEQFPNKKS